MIDGFSRAGAGEERRRAAATGAVDDLPIGVDACRPMLQTIVNHALQQSLIARKIDVEEMLTDPSRAFAAGASGAPGDAGLSFNLKGMIWSRRLPRALRFVYRITSA